MARFVLSLQALCGPFLALALLTSSWGVANADSFSALKQNSIHQDDHVGSAGSGKTIGDLAILASEYTDFREFVLALKERQFMSSAEIDWALYKVKQLNAEKLSQAWIAYNVLIVSAHPDFRLSVLDAANYYGRSAFVEGATTDYNYVRSLNGSSDSIKTAYSIAHSDVTKMDGVSKHLKKQAHTLQKKRWAMQQFDEVRRPKAVSFKPASKSSVLESVVSTLGDKPVRNLQEATKENADGKQSKSKASPFRVDLSEDENASFIARKSIANKITTLAALKVLGIDDLNMFPEDLTKPDRFSVRCFKKAQANLRQCLSAAHLRFEVPFCIAQHGVMEKGKCIAQ